jgi:signal transduction histidine kinase
MQVTHSGDGGLKNEICQIKEAMSEAMDSIRNSVHDLHDESVDLETQLQSMIEKFTFCPIELRYDAGDLPGAVKYCFIAIAREALNNIAKHSDASKASVTVTAHPAFCRLAIEDNGTIGKTGGAGGIGLSNMADRVEALGGVFRAEHSKGFKIFISIPKEKQP